MINGWKPTKQKVERKDTEEKSMPLEDRLLDTG